MSQPFEISQPSHLKAIRLFSQFRNSTGGFVPEVQRLRRRKDPGLAHIWQDTTGIMNSTLYDLGAGVSYTAMRFELDRTQPRFRVSENDSERFRAEFVGLLNERAATPEGGVLEEAERLVTVSGMTVMDWSFVGPHFRRYLEVLEGVSRTVGLRADDRLSYILGTLSMITPITQKLERK